MKILCYLVLLWLPIDQVCAKSFGVIGEIFPVAEKSFLELIEERLVALNSSGALRKINQEWIQAVALHANRPRVLNLARTAHSLQHNYVPEVILGHDIIDDSGHILYSKGTQVNALFQMPSYRPCWLFFNADDEAQLNWADQQKNNCLNPKFILTGGAVNTAEKRLRSVIYFDQAGKITSILHIAHVPAKATRFQNHLVIHEMAIKENGDEL